MPNKVFISYRREDSQYQAGRIYEAFVRALPPDTVFMDVDSMAPGHDFVEALEGWVQQCDVLLALIGPRWVDSTDPRTNLRRLDNPEDFVRIEVRGALARKIPVVPVLLDAAKMPTAAELPDDIKALPRRNAEFVDFRTFDADVQRLIKRLKIGSKIEQPGEAPGPQAGGISSQTSLAKPGTLFERIRSKAVSNPPSWPVVAGLFAVAVTIVFLAARMIERQQLDAQDGRLLAAVSRASVAEDAVRISESARRDVESKLTAAQATTEEARKASDSAIRNAEATATKAEGARKDAEARANDAADGLKKSERARIDAEARATSAAAAQAKTEESLQTAEKARAAAEIVANAAASAKTQAENSRQFSEVRANDAADALKKSDKARQEAEAKLAELQKVVNARPAPAPPQPSPSSASRKLLIDIGSKSRWVFGETTNCPSKDAAVLSLEVGSGSITWINGLGNRSIERVLASDENTFRTEGSGLTWAYSRNGDNIDAQASIGKPFVMKRCP